MKKLKLLFKILLIPLILVAIMTWLLTTESGLKSAVTIIKPLIPGKVQLKNLQGSLTNNITINKLNYQNSSFSAEADNVNLNFKLKSLWYGKIHLGKLTSNKIDITLRKQSTIQKNKNPSKKPFNIWHTINKFHQINIDDLSLQNITINNPYLEQPVIINSIKLHLNGNGKNYSTLAATLTSPYLNAKVDGILKGHLKLNWSIESSKLEKISSHLGGSLIDTGHSSIHHHHLVLKNTIKATNFKTPFFEATNLQSNIFADSNGKKPSNFSVQGENITFAKHHINSLDVEGDLKFAKNKLLAINLTNKPFAITIPLQEKSVTLNIKQSSFDASQSKLGLKIVGQLNIDKSNPIKADFIFKNYQLDSLPQPNQEVNGTLSWQTENLALLNLSLPNFENAKGSLSLHGSVTGTLAKPKIDGELNWKNGEAYIRALNIWPKNINLTVQSNENNLNYALKAEAGKGTLDITGSTDLSQKDFPTTLAINGNNFLLTNTRSTYLRVSPNLKANLTKNKIDVTGEVSIPKAYLRDSQETDVITLPQDVTFVKRKEEKSSLENIVVTTNVKLILGKDVRINMMGLKSSLRGALEIDSTPKTTPKASGLLTLHNGHYTLYGKELKVTNNSALHFVNSPIQNPNLNIRVYRVIHSADKNTLSAVYTRDDNRVVGMIITGNATNPKINLYSNPSDISNTDIFSYLILGQPSASAGSDKAQLLLQAANALNFKGSGEIRHLIGNLRETLGLSQLSLESEATEDPDTSEVSNNTSLVLGKYLAPKLYISYSYGLLDADNIFRISYFLSKKWTLQTETSDEGRGVDILYHIESK